MFFLPLALAADLRTTLSAHDFAGCATLGTPTDALYTELVATTDPAILPSTVPMRAASCLLDLYAERPELATVVTPWMADPERQGLALLALGKLDALPSALSVSLATAALQTTDARARARFVTRVEASARPEVRALVRPE